MNEKLSSTYQPTVMIIDDDATIRMQAVGFLTQAGFKVAEASSADAALLSIDEAAPDLILLDVEMPGMNGFELCSELRKSSRFLVTPILMLTGLENSESINSAYDAGATDFATKPINWSLLSHRLRYMHRSSLASKQLAREQASLAAAQRIAKLGSWELDVESGKTIWSSQLYEILGLTPNHIEPSKTVMLDFVHADDVTRVIQWFADNGNLSQSSFIDHQIVLPDGNIRRVRQQVEPEFDIDGILIRLQATVQDITKATEVENKVKQLAYYDTLTNLPNRLLFHESLERIMRKAKYNGTKIAILFFDLDDFKRINDTFGHVVGDKLLQQVASRLESTFSDQSCFISRMGGDEFTLILSRVEGVKEVEQVAEKIINSMTTPFSFENYELFTSPSIGIALYPQDGDCADTLLKNADMAMYEAKKIGKNSFKVHDREMDDNALKHYEIDTQMRTALECNEFTLNFQPQLDLNTGDLYSAEALLRWNNDTLGFVSPADFIPIAEENGLILPIGTWVLRSSCEQAVKWLKSGFAIPSVAVNISTLQFMHAGFPDLVKTVLAETGLPAEHLELEITESLLASDTHQAVDTLILLNKIGVKLSIDDFGTGYSSLSQLKNFPIHRLKIDQSFIKNITENKDDAAITRAVIAMSKTMNIRVLAEGVETAEHLEFLRKNGCDEVQGYFISRPAPAEQIQQEMPELLTLLAELFDMDCRSEIRKTG